MAAPSKFASEWRIILIAITGTLMVILDQTIFNVALARIMAVFNETADKAQLIISAYLLATAVSTPAAAFLSTRFGIKRVYLFAQAAFLIGSILCGISWNVQSLILFRVVQGLAGGLLMPLVMTFLFTSVPPEERGSAMAIFGIPIILAPAIGPTLGGWLVDSTFGWRACFYVNVPVIIPAILLGASWIRDTSKSFVPFDFWGFLLAAIGFGSLLYGLTYAPTYGWHDSRVIGLLSVGLIGLVLWVILELHVKFPMLDLRIFTYSGYANAIAVNMVTTIGLFSAIFLLPLFLQNVRGLSAFETGLLLVPGALGPALTMPLSGRLYDKIGPRLPVMLGLIIAGVTSIWFQSIDVTTPDSQIRLLLFLRGLGLGLCMMPVMTYALAAVPSNMTAQASALTNVARTVFASLGTAAFASLLTNFQEQNLATIVQTIGPNSVDTLRIVATTQVTAMQAGMSSQATQTLIGTILYQLASAKAFVMAFQTNYLIAALVMFTGIIPCFLLPHGKPKIVAHPGPMMG